MNDQNVKEPSYWKANWKYILGVAIGAGIISIPKLLAIIAKLLCVCLVAAIVLTGCKNPQATALNTLSTAEQTTTAAYDSYLALVIKGSIPTNDVPKYSHLYNQFQADMIVAIVAVQGNTNATAPASILSESTSLINQLTPLTTGK